MHIETKTQYFERITMRFGYAYTIELVKAPQISENAEVI